MSPRTVYNVLKSQLKVFNNYKSTVSSLKGAQRANTSAKSQT